MYTALDAVLGKSPSVAEILATLDEMFLPPGAPGTKVVPTPAATAQVAKSYAPPLPELGKKPVRTTAINLARPVRPSQPVRRSAPNPPRKAPAKRQLTEGEGRQVVKLLRGMHTVLAREVAGNPRTVPAAATERPRESVYLTKMERLTQPAREVEGIVKRTHDSRRVAHEPSTLLERFAPRSFA